MRVLVVVACTLLAIVHAGAVEHCQDYSTLKNLYFGDLHTHTSFSLDAYQFGTRTEPAAAYAYAAIGRLDFATVTDHAEWLSTDYGCTRDPSSPFYDAPFCTALRAASFPTDPLPCPGPVDGPGCGAAQASAWSALRQATETANDPCNFTTFHAYEWTLLGDGPLVVLHKNVYFRNATVPALPLDAVSYPSAPLLWAGLAAQCNPGTGCEALTIPHNMNQSVGQAFTVDGYAPIDLNRMMAFQRLAEIHQHKGSSECLTDTADSGAVSACDFEVDPGRAQPQDAVGYARPAMTNGLLRYATDGFDPTKLGFVGGTDDHDGTPGAAAESHFNGHLGGFDDTVQMRLTLWQPFNPGGLTGIWAEENTRDALWAALRRRETFATSGPRLTVRFYEFAGTADPCADPDFPSRLVRAGAVPMGGSFATAPGGPRFVVYALPDRTPLAAVDIVKGTVAGGAATERVSTIPFTDPPYCVTWTDPGYDPSAPAFYYARVRERPTWRWSHYDCVALRASNPFTWTAIAPGCGSSNPAAGGLDYMIQERAWTSSIWHLPGGPAPVPTTYLRLRDGSLLDDPRKRDFVFRSATRASAGGTRIAVPARSTDGDPTLYGATLTVQNPVTTGETATIALPAAGWRATGTRYVFAAPSAAAVQRAVVAADRIVIAGGGRAWPFTLDEPHQGGVAVRLALGTGAAWCATAPPRSLPTSDVRDHFDGKPQSPAPDQCPLLDAVP